MKKLKFKLITLIIIINITLGTYFLIINGHGAAFEVEPRFGSAPVIDGTIDSSVNEWNKAIKERLNLYPNISSPSTSLPVDLWIMQNGTYLYISIQFSLEYHSDDEFVGILISNNQSEATEDFKDAKIVQFSNLSSNEFTYKDYYIYDSIYHEDSHFGGNGASILDGDDITYEFSIPVENDENRTEDVFLNRGPPSYAFTIIFGETPSYPDGIMLSNIILIEIQYIPITPEIPPLEILYMVLTILIFGTIGILYGLYIYRIVKLKEKIKRVRT